MKNLLKEMSEKYRITGKIPKSSKRRQSSYTKRRKKIGEKRKNKLLMILMLPSTKYEVNPILLQRSPNKFNDELNGH